MGLVLRTITGTIKHQNGSAWVGGDVVFTLQDTANSSGITVPVEELTVTTDSNGDIKYSNNNVQLYTLEDSFLRYTVELPSGETYTIDLPDGNGAISLDVLIQTASLTGSNDSVSVVLQNMLNTHENLRASTTVFGHVKVDGTTITATNGVISSVIPNHTHSTNDLIETVVTQNANATLTSADSGKIYVKNGGTDSTLTLPTTGLVAGRTKIFALNLTESYLIIDGPIKAVEIDANNVRSRLPGSSAEFIWLGSFWLLRNQTGEWV